MSCRADAHMVAMKISFLKGNNEAIIKTLWKVERNEMKSLCKSKINITFGSRTEFPYPYFELNPYQPEICFDFRVQDNNKLLSPSKP